jgi:hypothetical protein
MARTKQENRRNVTTRDGLVVAFRATKEEEEALQYLLIQQQAIVDAAGVGAKVTAASLIRNLIKREAQAKGLWAVVQGAK